MRNSVFDQTLSSLEHISNSGSVFASANHSHHQHIIASHTVQSQRTMSSFDSTRFFCSKCLVLPWITPPDLKDWNDEKSLECPDHYQTLGQLEASADSGCPLCQLCYVQLMKGSDIPSNYADAQLCTRLNHRVSWFYIHIEAVLYTNGEQQWRAFELLFTRERTVSELQSERPGLTHRIRANNLNDDLSRLAQDTILPWLKSCLAHKASHHRCQSDKTDTSLPTRLIEVGSKYDKTVRLVDTTKMFGQKVKHDYLILSYCWGDGNGPARTTQTNLEQRLQSGIVVNTLPQTVRDAIYLTRAVGVQYLWVDAICIIQSDKPTDPNEDWEAEALKMGAYYSKSLCCIYASHAYNSSTGFIFKNRRGFPWRPIYLQKPGSARRFVPRPDTGVIVIDVLKHPFYDQLDQLPIMKRAWCLQEWLLPIRKLHWTGESLFWECRGVFGSPDTTPTLSDTRVTLHQLPLFSKPEGSQFPLGWFDMVPIYSSKELTYETDRLAAVQGIADELCSKHNDQYFAGMFRSCVIQGLAWQRVRSNLDIRPNELFPSWSWASMPGIWYRWFSTHQKPVAKCIHFGPSVDSEGINDFDEGYKRSIGIDAPFLDLEVEPVKSSLDYYGQGPYGTIAYTSPNWSGAGIWVIPDVPGMPVDRLEVMILTRHPHISDPSSEEPNPEIGKVEYYGLVMQRLPENQSQRVLHNSKLCKRKGHIQIIVPEENDKGMLDLWTRIELR